MLATCRARCFVTIAYIDGEDLASLLRRIGRLPARKALEIARQVCAGLAAAHERGPAGSRRLPLGSNGRASRAGAVVRR